LREELVRIDERLTSIEKVLRDGVRTAQWPRRSHPGIAGRAHRPVARDQPLARPVSGPVVSFGVRARWGDFQDTLGTALGAWAALAVAAGGGMPDDTFCLG
jgi:hypothetical protein